MQWGLGGRSDPGVLALFWVAVSRREGGIWAGWLDGWMGEGNCRLGYGWRADLILGSWDLGILVVVRSDRDRG